MRSLCSTANVPGQPALPLGRVGVPSAMLAPLAGLTNPTPLAAVVQPPGSTPSKSLRKRLTSGDALAHDTPVTRTEYGPAGTAIDPTRSRCRTVKVPGQADALWALAAGAQASTAATATTSGRRARRR